MKTELTGNFFQPSIFSLIAACGGASSIRDMKSQVVEVRLFRLVSCIILSICFSGCVINNSYEPEKFFKFDRLQSLEKFEGVYDNRGHNVPALTSFIWPAAEVPPLPKGDVAIEFRFKRPKMLIVRVYKKASLGLYGNNLVKQGVFEEGKDFFFENGVISDRGTSNANDQNTEGTGAFMPVYDTSDALLKQSYIFGIDQYGNGKLRVAKYSAGLVMLVPLVVKEYSDIGYPKIAD